MDWMKLILLGCVMLASPAFAGPVTLGGDDLNCHGERDGGGLNIEGWLYIEKALTDIEAQVTRSGPFTTDIAMLGSPEPVGCPPACPNGDANEAGASAAANAGLSIAYFDGDIAIEDFFTDLGSGTVNPKIIYLPGTDCSPDLNEAEGQALTNNAAAISAFVASGGGLMSHGCDGDDTADPNDPGDVADCTIAYGWLQALIPGLDPFGECSSSGAELTPAGQTALPGVSNSDIDSNAGPCHNSFSGNLGTLTSLAQDGNDRTFILGGIVGAIAGGGHAVPALGSAALVALFGILALTGIRRLR
jgi:hypothetical protein